MTGKSVFILAVLIASSFFLYGFLAYVYEFFPYEQLVNTKRVITPQESSPSDYPLVFETDAQSLIKIKSEDDVIKKKEALVDFFWNGNGFPSAKLPDLVENDISDSRYSDLKNLQRIDKISIIMDYKVDSIAYLFLAESSNENLIIYHQGHKGDFINGKEAIQFFLEQGYSVLALSMPLKGMNSQPIVDLPNHGKIKLVSHNQFFVLDSPEFSSMKFWVEPVAVSLNYLDKMFEFESYNMVGLSGGGRTAMLYSAIDDRISHSYSVFNNCGNSIFPPYIRQLLLVPSHHPDQWVVVGHYERDVSRLYDTANILELYVMSSYGEERKAIHIFNKYDSGASCDEFHKTYEDDIKLKISQLGDGTFNIYLDDTTSAAKEHSISDHALTVISKHMTT